MFDLYKIKGKSEELEFSQINEEDFFNSLGEFEEFEVNSGESDSDSDEVPESRALNILNFIFKWNDSIK